MSVTKINGFRAPYRSKTLRDELDTIAQRNGVLAIDQDVYQYSGNIYIPPFTVIQQGMLISKSVDTVVPFPSGLTLPFYVTVSSPTAAVVDDLTFQFASSPFDVAVNEVILAEYDGVEFRQMPAMSLAGIISDSQQINVDLKTTGPKSGLTTSVTGLNYTNLKGVIIDTRGRTVRLDSDLVTPIIQADPSWDRCDRVIYRLPEDDEYRIGHRKLTVGGTFNVGAQTLFDTTVASNTIRHNQVRSVVDSSNALHTFYTEGFGEYFEIYYTKYNASRNTQLVAGLLIGTSTSEYFDVAIDGSSNLHVVYVNGLHVYHLKLNNVGGVISGPYQIDSGVIQCDRPRAKIDVFSSKLYVVYTSHVGPNNDQIYFTSRTLSGALVTAPKKLTSTITNLTNPHFVVNSDLLLYIAYEDTTNQAIYYLVTDDIGVITISPVLVSNNTGSTSYGTLINQATQPRIGFTDNKNLFIVFLQKKTVSSYGLTIYQGGTAFMPNLLSPVEAFTAFDVVVDDFMNELHIVAAQSTTLDYIKVSGLTTVFSVQLNTLGAYSVSLLKDLWGSLVHTWALPQALTFTNAGAVQTVGDIGPAVLAGMAGTIVLTSFECSFLISSLTYTPVVGNRLEISLSPSNNGFYIVTAKRIESYAAANDTLVLTLASAFVAAEVPSVSSAQFATPDGNEVHFVKSVSEKDKTRALRMDVLSTDTLLTRCLFPGPLLLNYFSGGTPQVNSDLFGMYGNIDVDWSASAVGSLTMSAGSVIVDLVTYFKYYVNGGTFPMTTGDALYVVLDGVTPVISPQVTPIVSLPWGLPIQVLGFMENNEFVPHLFSVAGMGELTVGESVILGQDLSKVIRYRLGITGEVTYQAYTSTRVITSGDNYPGAISKLDDALGAVISDYALEEPFIVGPGGQSIFTVTTFTFSTSNARPDIQVFVNDRRAWIDPAGGSNYDYKKNSDVIIEFNYTIPEGTRVLIRQERTGGTLTGGGFGVDLTNIDADIQPLTNGAHSVGTTAKAWSGIFIKDKVTAQVYELEVVSGVFGVEPRP